MNYIIAPDLAGGNKGISQDVKRDMILKAVCSEFSITQKDLYGKKRTREMVEPRQIACYLLKKYAGFSYTQIGRLFNRDHTTAIQSVRAVEDHIETEEEYSNRVNVLLSKISK